MENTNHKQTNVIEEYRLITFRKKSEFIQNHRDIHEFKTTFNPDDSGAASLSSILRRLTHKKDLASPPECHKIADRKISQNFSNSSIPGKREKPLIL